MSSTRWIYLILNRLIKISYCKGWPGFAVSEAAGGVRASGTRTRALELRRVGPTDDGRHQMSASAQHTVGFADGDLPLEDRRAGSDADCLRYVAPGPGVGPGGRNWSAHSIRANDPHAKFRSIWICALPWTTLIADQVC